MIELFLSFLKIGTFTFGGGYGMISVVRDEVLKNGWLTDSEFMDMIAVSESTPGPMAVNIATFVGASQAGFPGALVATFGVILPSFIIILLLAALIKNFLKFAGVNAFLSGVRPAVVALIISTGVILGLNALFAVSSFASSPAPDFRAIAILTLLCSVHFIYKRIKKSVPPPIMMILFSALAGIAMYSFRVTVPIQTTP